MRKVRMRIGNTNVEIEIDEKAASMSSNEWKKSLRGEGWSARNADTITSKITER